MKRSTSSYVCNLSLMVLGLFLAEDALCAPAHDPKMVQYVNDAIDIMEQHSIYRNRISWQQFRQLLFESTEELTELSHAHAAIENALLAIGDNNSGVIPAEEMDALVNDGVESSRLSPWTPVEAKLIGGRIGYISVPSLVGRNSSRTIPYIVEMHNLMQTIDSEEVCGWIVDLRNNTGGNLGAMLAGIGPVLGSGEAGGGVGPDGKIHVRQFENDRRAYKLKNRYPPVAVLIGGETSGNGEAMALAFVGREMSLTFGAPTAGLTTARWAYPLPDGSFLSLSRGMLTDRIHRIYYGPIQPQTKATENEVIDVAAEWLKFSDPCH